MTKSKSNLCLTVKMGEYILIGEDIKITHQKKSGPEGIRVLIEAPRTVRILRERLINKTAQQITAGEHEGE